MKYWFIDKDNKEYVAAVGYKPLDRNEVYDLMSKEQTVTYVNDIYSKYTVEYNNQFDLKVCTKDQVKISKGHRFVTESYDQHQKKKLTELEFDGEKACEEEEFIIYENDGIYYVKFNCGCSFRDFKDVQTIKKAQKWIENKFKENGQGNSEHVSYFCYGGEREQFWFKAVDVSGFYENAFPIFVDDFVKNLEIDCDFYKNDVNYIEDIYE
ncbi:hypothetical protein ECANGB1_706 [Enterospora canceri]|uniref:Uncharacterized protein n=1 Tax=Enterospora canceri TaxID=1081671 RepID=A0A1Y1S7J7_9MICR|nr:hypothetical protein ECANGB1_706 [Enterospora canceri]